MISYGIIWYHMISYYIIYHMISYDITWYHMISWDITWHHMISYDIMWYLMRSYIYIHSSPSAATARSEPRLREGHGVRHHRRVLYYIIRWILQPPRYTKMLLLKQTRKCHIYTQENVICLTNNFNLMIYPQHWTPTATGPI